MVRMFITILYVGKQAVTHINQDGYSMNLIYRDPYYSGMLAQNATLAVKFAQAQAITQDTAIRNLLSTRLSTYRRSIMAEYSRLASGQVKSTGGATAVILPFIPNYIEISNKTRRAGANTGVTRAWWETDMGQGAAFLTTTTTADLTSFIDATRWSGKY